MKLIILVFLSAIITQKEFVIGLIIVVFFFAILLIYGIIKSYKLKAESERLSKSLSSEKKSSEDYSEGHIYGD